MLKLQDQQELQKMAADGALIITANRRLQRSLIALIADQPFQRLPDIYAADDWIQQKWLDLQDQAFPGADRTLLSPYQSRKLWQEIVAEDPPAQALISPAQLAQKADAAAVLVDEWNIALDAMDFEQRDEYLYFRRWHARYCQRLQDQKLGTAGYSRAVVQSAFESAALPRTGKIVLYGYDDVSPGLSSLFTAAAEQVEHWRPTRSSLARCLRTSAADSEAEIRAAALWSRNRFEANSDRGIGIRIGIIVPQLTAWRAMVERIFTEVYETATWLPEQPRITPPFNFSAGVPLATTPLVADGLLLLSLNLNKLPPETWRRLLLSPFWGTGLDDTRRALLHPLNRSTKTQLSLSELRRACEKAQDENDWPLATVLNKLAENLRRQSSKQSYMAWASYFAEQLELCNWPGDRSLDSPEFQQHQHFYQLLDQFSQCDASLSTPVNLAVALTNLRELADTTVFQAQTQASPVQILGLLEGAGLEFDSSWVMDLADTNWPPPAKPNPFIPLAIQTQLNLPRSSAERELRYAAALTARLQESADEIIFSWPASEGEVSLQPSQLISAVDLVDMETLVQGQSSPLQTYSQTVSEYGAFEWIDCSQGPPWEDLAKPLPGGTGAIKLQALCPFNAFAQYRLGAYPQERPTPGFSAAERGTIVHALMASVWRELENHSRLMETNADSLEELVREKAETTLRPWQLKRSDLLHPQFYRLELQRLEALAMAWLKLESERPSFTVITTESEQQLSLTTPIGTALLTGRIDRIDQLMSGKRIIIDYKTGNASINQWQGERPVDLQLPLYALAQPDEVVAIAFAELNARRVAFAGVGQLPGEDEAIPGIVPPNAPKNSQLPEEWQAVLDYWRTAAVNLVQEFLDGACSTEFSNKSQAQYYRHLEPLNRVMEEKG